MLGESLSTVSEARLGKLAFNDAELLKARPRPKSKLASYLSTNRNADQNDAPSFDWSSLGETDEAYEPVPDLLSHTLQQHVMNNPMADLPAQYNNLVMRLIEDHRRLKMDNGRLSQELGDEVENHMEDNETFRQTVELYLREGEVAPHAVPEAGVAKLPLRSFHSGDIAHACRPSAHVDTHPVQSSRENSPNKGIFPTRASSLI